MRYLYLDTSSSFLYAGIVKDNDLVAEIMEEMGGDLSKISLLKISEMFNSVSLKPNDIDKIIVVNGPGSFTGIRVGITIAKTYAWGLKKDITTISSLEAMAISSDFDGYKVPMIDARRGYVYASIYDKDCNIILKSSHIKLDILKDEISKLNGNVVAITNDEINMEYEKANYQPNILKIVQTYKDKKPINPHMVNPEYLKLTEAEEKNNKQ
ncbi:MAG: tRNA (adenosine(37)-N6)-threonylcarbamoyltransferase complex dimerization subunit type 1 TsaB [Bacilli bacterium]|nr:tRNA (adenosine(37)-N6)-threonylcarbamoyltransferase complex dimerization subunit type 1 TsaB [Bacilli bacterium]